LLPAISPLLTGMTIVFDSGDPSFPTLPESTARLYEENLLSDSSGDDGEDASSSTGDTVGNGYGRRFTLDTLYHLSAYPLKPIASLASRRSRRSHSLVREMSPLATVQDGRQLNVPTHGPAIPLSQMSKQTPSNNELPGKVQISSPAVSGGNVNDFNDGFHSRTGSSIGTRRARRRYSKASGVTTAARRAPGWEPGIDIRTTDVSLQSLGSTVTIIDYSVTRYKVMRTEVRPIDGVPTEMNHGDFLECLHNRPSWSKVRWINVNRLSWEVISAISSFYKLHRLAIEDMVDIPQRTKVDKYPTHTFCCFPLHKLMSYKKVTSGPTAGCSHFLSKFFGMCASRDYGVQQDRTSSTLDTQKGTGDGIHRAGWHTLDTGISLQEEMVPPQLQMRTLYQWTNPTLTPGRSSYLESRRPLVSRNRVVGVEQVSLFLTNQSTVISFFETSAGDVERPLLSRLSTESTILRESSDPSILLQAIIDACVDLILPIVASYRGRLDDLESDALLNPSIEHTQDLHLVNAEVTVLRNSIAQVTSMINSLRHAGRQEDAPAAGGESVVNPSFSYQSFGGCNQTTIPVPRSDSETGQGRISDLAAVYLADVADHTLSYTQDLDIMRNNAKAMTDLIFNTISIQSSDAVKLLSLVTVIFLPMSFLTGYFGMNFHRFDALDNGEGYYWGIAVPCAVFMSFLLMYSWLADNFRKVAQFIRRRRAQYKETVKEKRKKKKRSQDNQRNIIV
jgi:Mg2+ and Co2+ transporter CorA